jgi:hypothetical protein
MTPHEANQIVLLYQTLNQSPIKEIFDTFIGERVQELREQNGNKSLLGNLSQRDANSGGITELIYIGERMKDRYEEALELLKTDKSKDPVETKEI